MLFSRASNDVATDHQPHSDTNVEWGSTIRSNLAEQLNDIAYPPSKPAFKASQRSYYSIQEQEATPRCIVKPQNVKQISKALDILKAQFDTQTGSSQEERLCFVVRSGGHGLEAVANAEGGAVSDLSSISEVTVSGDGQSTVNGAGARWADVSSKLDQRNLAVTGGRNPHV